MPAPSDIFQFLRGQLFQTPRIPDTDLTGRTIAITGANSGLGFESAKQIASLNVSTLVLGCRDVEKGTAARKAIISMATNRDVDIQVWQLDMADHSNVRSFADRLNTLPRLDAFLVNAGISTNQYNLVDGYEEVLVVNVLTTFLLAQLALPVLKRTAFARKCPTHLTITGSNVHAFADPSDIVQAPKSDLFAFLSNRETANMANRYFLSKLLVMLCVRQMAEELRVEDQKVIINSPSPGWCKTPLFRADDGGFFGRNMLKLIGRTADIGARCLVCAVIDGPETHGQYVSECQAKSTSVWVRGEEGRAAQKWVWSEVRRVIDGWGAGSEGNVAQKSL